MMLRLRPVARGMLIASVTVLLLAATHAHAQPRLPLLFSDGAVLQRDQPMPVWGWATPGATIRVEFDGHQADAVTDPQGHWQVMLPAHGAGGPYVLKVNGDGATLQANDLLVGDVWLASGQSNMEFTVSQGRDAEQTIAAANDPQLRHFKVPKSWSGTPQSQLVGGDWKQANPREVGEFSAAGYFFAGELREQTGVPIGIINSSWGGSAIEAWMDAATQGIDAAGVARQGEQLREQDRRALASTRERLARWPLLQGDAPQWQDTSLDDADWDRIPVPGLWESSVYPGMDGVAWYRASFTLSAAEARAGITLGVGRIDDSDSTWVNGQQVGQTTVQYNLPRQYQVPASALHAGRNQIAVRVTDSGGGGGIHGQPGELFVQPAGGTPRAIDGEWKFRPAQVTVAAIDDKNQLPTLLYNQMIHPLQRFPIKGVIWYQGEANATDEGALRYRDQFAALIRQWRAQRGQPQLPFLWVQLANFKAGADHGGHSPWAILRESQSSALALPATGQAVTIDIGNPDDIHPINKQDVGHRLALAARHLAYGQTLVYSAPSFKAAHFEDGQATLSFDLHGGALAVRGGGQQVHGLQLAGADRRFHPASARIQGEQVIVQSAAVPAPVAVRYGWSENPVDADLINRQQLPVSPFRSDRW